MMRQLCALGLVLSVTLASVWAEDEPAAKGRGRFAGKRGQAFDPEKLFKKLDTNGDGKLTLEEFKKISELQSGRKQGRLDADKLAAIQEKIEEKTGKKIDLEKLKQLAARRGGGKAGNPDELFKKLDANDDGFLTLKEFRKISDFMNGGTRKFDPEKLKRLREKFKQKQDEE